MSKDLVLDAYNTYTARTPMDTVCQPLGCATALHEPRSARAHTVAAHDISDAILRQWTNLKPICNRCLGLGLLRHLTSASCSTAITPGWHDERCQL